MLSKIFKLLLLIMLCWFIYHIKELPTTIPGRIVRWCLGEPGATQGVNDTANKIISLGLLSHFEKLCDDILSEFLPKTSTLKNAEGGEGYEIPINKIPEKFRNDAFGGMFNNLEVDLRPLDNENCPSLVFNWGHMRHAIIIFKDAQHIEPKGFFVRKLNNRIYIVANES